MWGRFIQYAKSTAPASKLHPMLRDVWSSLKAVLSQPSTESSPKTAELRAVSCAGASALFPCILPGLSVDGLGTLPHPLTDMTQSTLLEKLGSSPRSALVLPTSKIQIENPAWHTAVQQVVTAVHTSLKVSTVRRYCIRIICFLLAVCLGHAVTGTPRRNDPAQMTCMHHALRSCLTYCSVMTSSLCKNASWTAVVLDVSCAVHDRCCVPV